MRSHSRQCVNGDRGDPGCEGMETESSTCDQPVSHDALVFAFVRNAFYH